MRIFFTGANGFIGGAVASTLIAEGHRVRGLVRGKASADAVAAQGVDAVVGTLDDLHCSRLKPRRPKASSMRPTVVTAAPSSH